MLDGVGESQIFRMTADSPGRTSLGLYTHARMQLVAPWKSSSKSADQIMRKDKSLNSGEGRRVAVPSFQRYGICLQSTVGLNLDSTSGMMTGTPKPIITSTCTIPSAGLGSQATWHKETASLPANPDSTHPQTNNTPLAARVYIYFRFGLLRGPPAPSCASGGPHGSA